LYNTTVVQRIAGTEDRGSLAKRDAAAEEDDRAVSTVQIDTNRPI
jgi:hypothetical protein